MTSSTSRHVSANEALHAAVERHLLTAQLASIQARSVERNGYLDLVWPETYTVLRVYTDRFPTVDVFQLNRGRFTRPGPYLCSFDVRAETPDGQRLAGGVLTVGAAVTPLACARLVVELFRRGALRAYLNALPSLRVQRAHRDRG